jgi:hypothetical protein
MQVRTIALTSASDAAISAVTHQLLAAAAGQQLRLNVLQGVKTALEAQAVYMEGGELWRIGDDEDKPELDALVDRNLDDVTPEVLANETAWAWTEFVNKTRVAA